MLQVLLPFSAFAFAFACSQEAFQIHLCWHPFPACKPPQDRASTDAISFLNAPRA